jgi:hypothetical protein
MLCGSQRPLRNYDPSNYDAEIYLITKRSKGRGGGWDDTFEPILGDDTITPVVKNRILQIVRVFRERGIISDFELGFAPRRDEKDSFLKRIVDRALFQAFTENGEGDRVKELTALLDKLKADYENLDEERKKLDQEYFETTIQHAERLVFKDLLDYALMHFLKYCDAQIGGLNVNDFRVFLMSLDIDSMTLLACLYQNLTVEEWCHLMDKIQGVPPVQASLDYYSMLKKAEAERSYNKLQLMNDLMMFRFLKLSS